jgi:1-pyrroline-5-carboxylate dehydrogenase
MKVFISDFESHDAYKRGKAVDRQDRGGIQGMNNHTVIETSDPKYLTMCEEIFGPVLTIYNYPAAKFEKTLDLVNTTSKYALTGAIISQDRGAIELATQKLRHAAGNFYINDKPTGAVVGQQPFGGARGSGTNDKAGSMLNLYRWLSARTIKETFNPPTDYKYPFLNEA